MYDFNNFKWGIEHEFGAIKGDEFCDFQNTSFEDFDRVIEKMPLIESDYPGLRVGDLGIKSKRWYIEGFERFSEEGNYLRTDPKGFEIRTPICTSLDEAVSTLSKDFTAWQNVANEYGYTAAATSLNPFAEEYIPTPSLNDWEVAHRASPEEQTAYIHMLTYGPDISFSHPALSTQQIISIGKRFTFYSPYIVPFSFSSPFFKEELWGGLSRRTYYRTGMRPAALVFLPENEELVSSSPTLTEHARIPAEAGRIEFKAFDHIQNFAHYTSLGTLLLGIALSEELTAEAFIPDTTVHQQSATLGFKDEHIYAEALRVLTAAENALPDHMHSALVPLQEMLDTRTSPADQMIDTFTRTGSIIKAITIPQTTSL